MSSVADSWENGNNIFLIGRKMRGRNECVKNSENLIGELDGKASREGKFFLGSRVKKSSEVSGFQGYSKG